MPMSAIVAQVDKLQFLMPLIGVLAAATTVFSGLGYQVLKDLRKDVSATGTRTTSRQETPTGQ